MLPSLALATALLAQSGSTDSSARDSLATRAGDEAFRYRASTFLMHFVLEDGSPIPKDLSIQVFGGCEIDSSFGTGTLVLRRPGPNSSYTAYDTCYVRASAAGLRSWRGTFRENATIVLKRLGPHEGSAVSITILNAPAAAQKAYAKGEAAFLKGQLAEAEKQFKAALALYPNHAVAWSELGRLYEQQGQLKPAIEAYNQAIRVDPNYIKPLVQSAALESRRENWPAVLAATDTALALNPIEFPGAFYYRGLAHLQSRQFPQAATVLNRAIELDAQREFLQAYLFLSLAYKQAGNTNEAIAVLERLMASKPPQPLAERAQAQLQQLRAR